MEKVVEEDNKSTKLNFILTNPDWLDLPEPIATNIILEHLEIVDYIRFSAVCKKWYSIQKEHRIRYSPYPPPLLLPFPWLRCNSDVFENGDDRSILFYLPDKQKSYIIPFFGTRKTFCVIGYGHGCFILLLFECDVVVNPPVMHVFNPITGVLIRLPPCSLSGISSCTAHISSQPTDPNCTILVANYDEVYLYGLNNHNSWRKVDDCPEMSMNSITAFCNSKIFCMHFSSKRSKMVMIDTLLPDPVGQMITMDYSEIRAVFLHDKCSADLVDFFGELVMIVIVYENSIFCGDIEEFHVYRADFLAKKWVRMETLGDGVLFYSSDNTFALRAVDVGCKKNTIYSSEGFNFNTFAWRTFDLSTRDWIDGPPLSFSNILSNKRHHCVPFVGWSWFLPTLNYFSGAKTSGTCQNICLDA